MATRSSRIDTKGLPGFLGELFGFFDEAFARAGSEVVARIGGSVVSCRTDLPAYAETVRKALADVTPGTGGSCRIIVTSSGGLGLPDAPAWGESHYRERVVETALASGRYRVHYLDDIGFWQFYDRETDRGIQLMAAPCAVPVWDSGSPLRNFLHWHFSRRGLGLVHAGTLALDGAGLLLAGAGGSGKSGTVLAGVRHGLGTVGDDYVLAEMGHPPAAYPLFRTLKQDGRGFSRLGLDRVPGLSRELNWQGKHQFVLDEVSEAGPAPRIHLRALCLPEITHGPRTSFEPADAKSAFLSLVPSGITQMPGDRDGSFAFGARLARQLPAYHLRLGTDPAEIAGEIARFMGRIS